MKTTIVKDAIMLCVSNKNWFMPKHILIETEGHGGKRLSDIAYDTFEKYKKEQEEDTNLIDFTYYGDVKVVEGLT